jgi:uncharacterized protein (DUF1501 family)
MEGMIQNMELAARMQLSVPEISDLSTEPAHILRAYGADDAANPIKAGFARNCILARRLIEKGVRFVQVNRGGFDVHANAFPAMRDHGDAMDPALAALIEDLAQSGLLKKTMIVMLSEFGRTPKINMTAGRDHHPGVFSGFFAGGGVKGGQVIGKSTKDGGLPADNPVHVTDLFATMYRALGVGPGTEVIDQAGRPMFPVQGKPVLAAF